MRKYKAIISDLDGTLVGDDAAPNPELVELIRGFKNKDIVFSLAAGRPFAGKVQNTTKSLSITAPIIVRGGAQIIDPISENVLHAEYIDEKDVVGIVHHLQGKKLYCIVEKDNEIFTPDGDSEFAFYYKEGITFKNITDLSPDGVLRIFLPAFRAKFTVDTANEFIDELSQDFSNVNFIKVTYKEYIGMDITSSRATKFLAVNELCKIIKVSPDDCIGIGNSWNDIPLLSACGLKVAMGDSPEELKRIADVVLGTQAEGSLLQFFNKILLKGAL